MSNLVIEIVRDDGLGDGNPSFIADGSRWGIPVGGLENFGEVSYEVSTQEYAQYDGSSLMRERTPEQDRTMEFVARIPPEEARDEAMAFFIPHREYTVRCTAFGRTRHFKGRQLAFAVKLGGVNERTKATWTCLCTQPFWLSEGEHGYDIAEAQGMRFFPFVSLLPGIDLPGTAENDAGAKAPAYVPGFVCGIVSHTLRLENGGHVPTYPRFAVSASGNVENPTIRVTDAAGNAAMDVTVLVEMAEGDELVIDFDARPTAIELNGENVSHLVKPGSTLSASIGVGRYDVEWSAEAGDASMRVVPSIRERYTGI
ncbi:MAG TPA: hypothetical protein IAC12_03845 [Candidatus Aphodovivens avistercoris]|nr:hypothetical protein [Candidatus Aphodovivens avistercoris]